MSDDADRAAATAGGHLLFIVDMIDAEPDPAVTMAALSAAVVYALDKFALSSEQFYKSLASLREARARELRKRGKS